MDSGEHTPHAKTPWRVMDEDSNGQIIIGGEIEIATFWHHSVGALEKEMRANAARAVHCVNTYQELVGALAGMCDAYCALLLMKAEDPSRFKEPGSPYANALAALKSAGGHHG